ncbi:hypothetical protein ACF3NR_10680 [Vaginella massiliensis]|uniref:hypothetical protein n=1 Tax=Vaginella massiliensis TaxID=1816680 RepID=UPI000838ED3A|nr:hypothetical protein [Vaginella massiliensis]
MKKILTLILCGFSIYGFSQTDLEKNDLRGKIKMLEEKKSKAMIRMNHVEGYQQEYHKKVDYNIAGFLVSEQFFDEKNLPTYTATYTYDSDGKLKAKDMDSYNNFLKIDERYEYDGQTITIKTTENDVPVLEKKLLYEGSNLVEDRSRNLEEEDIFINEKNEYNAKNQLIKKTVDYDNGKYEINYRYNDLGLVVEEEMKSGNALVSKKIRQFNEKGDMTAEKMFDKDLKLKYDVSILYEYDAQNNWVKRTHYNANLDAPITNTTRKIVYY